MKDKYIFGPIISRRLGISLGLDIIPHKYCSLDCSYCEIGATNHLTTTRESFFPREEVMQNLRKYLVNKPYLDSISFSGSGEPTLSTDLGYYIRQIKEEFPNYLISVITNSSLLGDKQVRDELLDADIVLPSLDAVSEDVFQRINKPIANLTAQQIINGLLRFRSEFKNQIWLEIFIIPGLNDHESEILKIKDAVYRIKPDRIQLNSLDRAGTDPNIKAASLNILDKIRDIINYPNTDVIARSFSNNCDCY